MVIDDLMNLSYVDERRFVWVRLSGAWTIDELCAKPQSILAECTARKQDLLLLDLTELSVGPISTLDRYKLGSSIVLFSKKLRKVATAALPSFIDPDRFGERVARNRGVNVRVFSDPDEARRWLLEKD